MQFSLLPFTVLLALTTASPLPKTSTKSKAAASGASVLSSTTYDSISISGGTAGGAQAQAAALFSKINMNNLAGVSKADLDIIKGIHDIAEDAEVQAFNPAIETASGDAAAALQNSKIKNKALKLTAEVLSIQIKAAQGGDGSDLAAEQKKLANNIALDKKASGQASTAVKLSGSTEAPRVG